MERADCLWLPHRTKSAWVGLDDDVAAGDTRTRHRHRPACRARVARSEGLGRVRCAVSAVGAKMAGGSVFRSAAAVRWWKKLCLVIVFGSRVPRSSLRAGR